MPTHRSYALSLALVSLALAPLSAAQNLRAEFVTFTGGRPIAVTAPPGETNRIFVVMKSGEIKIVENGSLKGTPFLDWDPNIDSNGEGGLLGMAFHPDYANNGQFYISYTAPFQGGASVVSQLTVDPNDPNLADPTSETIIWGPWPQQQQSHKGGDLHFGPDGTLYFSIGDGSDGGTLEVTAQDLSDSRGKILRFDPDLPAPYIPADNPFVGDPNANDEIWAYGLRNPFRFAIDAANGDLYIGDVGATSWEEVDWAPGGTGGLNFGWPCREGTDCTGSSHCDCADAGLVYPIHQYGVAGCQVVISGAVYRGSLIPDLVGKYLFADFCSNSVYSFRWDGAQLSEWADHSVDLQGGPGGDNSSPVAFGTDGVGELYMLNHYAQRLWRILPGCEAENFCQANANSTGVPGSVSASGSFGIGDNTLLLAANDLPTQQFGYFLMSSAQGFVPNVGGSQGNLCLGAPQVRFAKNVLSSGPNGRVSFTPDLTNLPQSTVVQAGETWSFQLWYRDVNPTTTSNMTDGVAVVFCP